MAKTSLRNIGRRIAGWFGRDTRVGSSREEQSSDTPSRDRVRRRELLTGLAGTPLIGTFVLATLKMCGWQSHEERLLGEETEVSKEKKADAVTGPSKKFNWKQLKDLDKKVPKATIGKLKLSRMILGGNLIGGWAHARDLIYVSKLVKAYHTRLKIFETFRLAEACGINTILTNPILCDVIGDYWKNGGGKIKFISDCGGKDVLKMVQKSIDNGAAACYIQGATADRLVAEKDFDTIEKVLELIRRNKIPAGIGGHKLETIKACVEKGFEPDFWMKTLHHGNYWSAKHPQRYDNLFCEKPEETIAFMKEVPQPWIAFKVLGAGAIHPADGFKYAFEGGADFICVGMYDFQIVEDANIAVKILDSRPKRERPWHG